MKWFFLALGPMLLFLSTKNQLPPSATLHLQVQEVKAPLGVLRIALYDSEANFLDFKEVFASKVVPAKMGTTTVVIDSLPSGTYALALYQDQNDKEQWIKTGLVFLENHWVFQMPNCVLLVLQVLKPALSL